MHSWNEDFDKFVAHFTKYQDLTDADNQPENHIKVIDSDISRNVGFHRVAVHHITIPPGCRSSSPHAESLEEEMVFVLKGSPHLWLDGYIYDLKDGHVAGFPSGTGIAHTFINNTNMEVHLIVGGERTKNDNLCSFPINPELKESCGIWWDNPPQNELGPHNGLPGPVKDIERGRGNPSCLLYCPEIEKGKPFHYPGDNETFGEGFRITDKIGLKALGVWYEYLPPKRRSAFPHAHTHEEEFVYVLKGKPTVWIDGYAKRVEENHFAAFPSNTGAAHAILNETDEDIVYLCIGETQDFPDEKIAYPLNQLRNKECERKNWYWTDLPKREFGPHPGCIPHSMQNHLSLRIRSEGDRPEVISLFIDHNDNAVGSVDLHVNHPEVGLCKIEMMRTEESLPDDIHIQCTQLIEDYIIRSLECKLVVNTSVLG